MIMRCRPSFLDPVQQIDTKNKKEKESTQCPQISPSDSFLKAGIEYLLDIFGFTVSLMLL